MNENYNLGITDYCGYGNTLSRRDFLHLLCGLPFIPFSDKIRLLHSDVIPSRAIEGLSPEMRMPGPVEPNAPEYFSLNCQKILTVNLVDGTTAGYIRESNHHDIWIPHPIGNHEIVYAIIGRELSANPILTERYESSNPPPGSRYDGNYGIYYSQNNVPRTTYTPPLVAKVISSGQYIENFGGIGGRTNISIIRRLHKDHQQQILEHTLNSQYTIHRVPEQTADQSILLREELLRRANRTGVALSYPDMHRSSGCVNYDADTWRLIQEFLEPHSTLVVFTYPNLSQSILFMEDPVYANDPFRYGMVNQEGYWYNVVNRRGYFDPSN
jgi:hypothetical protein